MDVQPDPNNPAGAPPEGGESAALEADVLDVLSLSDTSSTADKIAKKSGDTPPEPTAAAPAPASPTAEGGVTAPSPSDTPPAGETPPQPAAPEPATTPPAPAATEPPVQSTPALQVDEQALRLASLEAEKDALRRELEALRASPQQGQPAPTAAPSPEQPAAEPPPYKYALTLPKAMQDDLVGDDPAKTITAINTIVNDLGTIVHNTVLTQVRAEMQGMITRLSGMAQEAQFGDVRKSAVEEAKADYYKVFPDHNNPLILPIIQAESQKLSAEFPGLSWGEQMRNALGQRVNAYLQQLGARPQEPANPNPNPVPARPATFLPSGQRASVVPESEIGQDVVDLLDPFSGGG